MSEQDNGQKTEAQLAEERLQRYKTDPFKFIEMSELIVCVIRSERGPMAYIEGSKPELQIAWAELNQQIMAKISRMAMEAAMKKKPLLHKARGFFNGLRGMKK